MISLTDVTRIHIEGVSFFLLILLLSALGVQGIWNAVAADFPTWSPLSYKYAVGIIVIWGTICAPIYATITAVKEWKPTPGFQKPEDDRSERTADLLAPATSPEVVRRARLDRLSTSLFDYAEEHAGDFPRDDSDLAIPDEAWELPDISRMRYLYVPGRKLGAYRSILAYEPGLYGKSRYVLFAGGRVRFMDVDEIRKALEAEAR